MPLTILLHIWSCDEYHWSYIRFCKHFVRQSYLFSTSFCAYLFIKSSAFVIDILDTQTNKNQWLIWIVTILCRLVIMIQRWMVLYWKLCNKFTLMNMYVVSLPYYRHQVEFVEQLKNVQFAYNMSKNCFLQPSFS